MPRPTIKFDDTVRITSVVIKFIAINEMPKDDEYITPLNVFVYTKKMNKPIANDMNIAIKMSGMENDAALSKKLKLNNCSNMKTPPEN